jgi:hypothetical protein
VGFLQDAEVAIEDVLVILLAACSNLIASDSNSKVFSNSWQNLILLCLVIHDGDLLLLSVSKLLSEETVTQCDNDRQAIDFGNCARDELSDEHHGSIADSRVTNCFEVSFIAYLHVFVEEVALWNSDVVEEHVAILFGVEANFWTNVASLNSR